MRFTGFMTAAVLVVLGCAQQEQSDELMPDETAGTSNGGSGAGSLADGGTTSKSGSSSGAGKPSTAGTGSGGKGGLDGGGDGGSAGSGGGDGNAGKAMGGSGGAGGSGSGGSSGAGGKASGGNGGAGGKASGGAAGMGGNGGSGGGGPCKANPSVPVAGLSLRYESEADGVSGTHVGSQLSVYNTSSMTFNLADLRVRYYLTNEVTAAITKKVNWAWLRPIAGGETDVKSKVQFDVVDLGCSATGADTYFEFTFKADAGLLAPQQYVVLSWDASNGATQNFDQNDDYSFSAAQAIGSDYSKVVLLQNNLNRLWGTEPN